MRVTNHNIDKNQNHGNSTMTFWIIVIFAYHLCANNAEGYLPSHVPTMRRSPSAVWSRSRTRTSWYSSIRDNTDTPDEQRQFADLPLPPSRKPGPFRGVRESLSHLSNNQRFVRKRAEELGDVFLTNIFFQPTVVVGGQEAVQEFVSETELKKSVIHSAFPDIFKELHTKWGALNLDANDSTFKEARRLFATIFGRNALEEYTPIINEAMDDYFDDLTQRVNDNPDIEILIVQELKEVSLQIFSKIFSGEGLSTEQVQMFNEYNNALLALPFQKKKIKKGRHALKCLKEDMLERYKRFQSVGDDDSQIVPYFFQQVSNHEGWNGNDDRIASSMLLFVWGAYIETASLMVDSMVCIKKYSPECKEKILHELETQDSKDALSMENLTYWDGLEHTLGVLRESLRLVPPGGGVPRYSDQDFVLQGYHIPAGLPVMMDPRVGNTDPKLFAQPNEFEPTRWIPEDRPSESTESKCPLKGTALKLGFGSWFPGGFGAHQCPGVPLAELTSKIFLSKLVRSFDGWDFNGGTTRKGEIKYVEVPIKIPVDDLSVKFNVSL